MEYQDGILASTPPAIPYSRSRSLGAGHVTKAWPISFNMEKVWGWLLVLWVCWRAWQPVPEVIFVTMLQEPKQRTIEPEVENK